MQRRCARHRSLKPHFSTQLTEATNSKCVEAETTCPSDERTGHWEEKRGGGWKSEGCQQIWILSLGNTPMSIKAQRTNEISSRESVHLLLVNIHDCTWLLSEQVYPAGAGLTGVHVNMRLWLPSISSGLQVTGVWNFSPLIPFECAHSLWSHVSFKNITALLCFTMLVLAFKFLSLSRSLSVFYSFFGEQGWKLQKQSASIKHVCKKSAGKVLRPVVRGDLLKSKQGALLRLLGGVMKAQRQAKGVKAMWILTEFTLSTLIDWCVCISDANELYNMCRKVPGANTHAGWGG